MNLPNKLSISRIIMIPIFLFCILPVNENFPGAEKINYFVNNTGYYIAVVIFIIASITDQLDGYIARKYNMVTNMGKFLDPIADKLLVTAALIAFVQFGMISSWVAIIIIGREFIVTGIRVIAASEGIVIAASNWGKVKTVIQITAIILALLKNYPFSLFTDIQLDQIIMYLAVLVTLYSGYDYLKKSKDVLIRGGM